VAADDRVSALAPGYLRARARYGSVTRVADLLAPGNTLASFRAAMDAGVDMIEFDVLSEHTDGSGRLLLAHDYEALHDGSPLTLEQGLAHLAAEEFCWR